MLRVGSNTIRYRVRKDILVKQVGHSPNIELAKSIVNHTERDN